MTAPRARRHATGTRAAAICAALLLGAALLSGTGPMHRGADATGIDAAWTDALWTAATPADGAFTALQLGTVLSLACSSPQQNSATITWQRPTGTPSTGVSYQLTIRQGTTTQTLTQATTTYVFNRPSGRTENVNITVQPTLGLWSGTVQSIVLTASQTICMRCP